MPQLLGAAVEAYVRTVRGGVPFASCLDAGGGTGLAGPFLRPLVSGTLSCVDLSPKMLEKAEAMRTEGGGPMFDIVLAKDLLLLERPDVLAPAERRTGVELVAAADVLVYFGELHELMQSFDR